MTILLNLEQILPFVVTGFVILIVLLGILYNRKRKGPNPITYIFDEKGKLQFEIYQSDTMFSIINHTHNDEVEQANFKSWDDLVSFIELEQRKWK